MARPTKLEDVQERLLEMVRGGSSYSAACAICLIHPETLRHWRDLGLKKNPREPYRSFALAFEQARYEGQETLRKAILAAGTGKKGDWRAAAFLLERQFPEEFGKRVEQRHTGADGTGPIAIHQSFEVPMADMSTNDVRELVDRLLGEKATAEPEP